MSRKPILTLADLHAYFTRRAKENERRAGRVSEISKAEALSSEGEIWMRSCFFAKAAAYENAASKVKLLMKPSWERGSNG